MKEASQPQIAICITARNRQAETKLTYTSIKKFMPPNSRLFLVDDASEKPYLASDHRFELNVGIPRAKNKCIELAMDWGADHVFLFDNDVIVLKDEWWKPYIESKEPHLQAEFLNFAVGKQNLHDNSVIYQNDEISFYGHARGYMLYFDKLCFETVGGFNVNYEKGMYEHGDLSNRIFNAGLTSYRYMDVNGSDELFKSLDQYRETKSSIDPAVRSQNLQKHRELFKQSWTSTDFCEYRENKAPIKKISGKLNNVVLASYLIGQTDTQRGVEWEDNLQQDLATLEESASRNEINLKVLTNSKSKLFGASIVEAESNMNPYFQRWLNQYLYLRDNPWIDYVFCVDATDVEILKDPFENIEDGVLYVGDELDRLQNAWLYRNSKSPIITRFLHQNRRNVLLNCGVVGGSREDVMQLCHDIFGFYFDNGMVEPVEMPVFNYVCYKKWADKIEYGRHITTRFKKFEYSNKEAKFRHK